MTTAAAGHAPLAPGKEGLFFLSYWKAANTYMVAVAGGYFESRGQVFLVPTEVKHIAEFQTRSSIPKAELIERVKSIRRLRN